MLNRLYWTFLVALGLLIRPQFNDTLLRFVCSYRTGVFILLLMEKRLNTHGQRQITSEHTQGLSQHILLVEIVQSRSDPYLNSFFL